MRPTLDIAGAIAQFPEVFSLRAFHLKIFRISKEKSYVSGDQIMLVLQVQNGGSWVDFGKGTIAELQLETMPIADSWEARVQALENEGLTRSDAQAVVDAEDLKGEKS